MVATVVVFMAMTAGIVVTAVIFYAKIVLRQMDIFFLWCHLW